LSGLKYVQHLRSEFPEARLVQQFFDYFRSTPLGFADAVRGAVKSAAMVTAVTSSIAADVGQLTGRSIEVRPSFHMKLPMVRKEKHRALSEGFEAVVIGNFQNVSMLLAVREIWRQMMDQVPGVGPLKWFAHEGAMKSLAGQLGEEIEWAGFYQGAAFLDRLKEADLCVVPVNVGTKADDDFARYSLPTRVTEPLALGLPVVALGSPDTALCRYLADHRVGRSCIAGPSAAVPLLSELSGDAELRRQLGDEGRAHALECFDVKAYRSQFTSLILG
jgi:hypothetical protein